ncbi:MAG: CAP domain-containing protein [Oscillospiraceae bacterium]
MSLTNKRDSLKVKQSYMREVDTLLDEADSLELSTVNFDEDIEATASTTSAPRGRKKPNSGKRRAGKVIAAIACALVLLMLGGSVIIAEPWVPAPKDSYIDPVARELPAKTLAVGEVFNVDVPLSDNETVSEVIASDADILEVDGSSVCAKGEYFKTSLSITTMEKELPDNEPAHKVALLGRDMSAPYDKLRSFLRNLIGIEKKAEPRTELRVLNRYHQEFVVDGLTNSTAQPPAEISAYMQNGVTLETGLSENEDVMLVSYNDATATVSLNKNENGIATFTVSGKADTKTKIKVIAGFWKDVSPEIYAEYRAALGVQAPAAAGDESSDNQENTVTSNTLRENKIFVPRRSIIYTVSVTDLAKTVVTTDLEDDGKRDMPENGFNSGIADDLLELVNKLRTEKGLTALAWSSSLESGAKTRSKELTELYSYTRPDGKAGISAADGVKGECISAGYLTARDVFNCWESNDTQREKMLSPEASLFGASMYVNEDGVYNNYWSGMFA